MVGNPEDRFSNDRAGMAVLGQKLTVAVYRSEVGCFLVRSWLFLGQKLAVFRPEVGCF